MSPVHLGHLYTSLMYLHNLHLGCVMVLTCVSNHSKSLPHLHTWQAAHELLSCLYGSPGIAHLLLWALVFCTPFGLPVGCWFIYTLVQAVFKSKSSPHTCTGSPGTAHSHCCRSWMLPTHFFRLPRGC